MLRPKAAFRFGYGVVAVLALTFGCWSAAYATLVDVAGEHYSFDGSTGLYWLDVTETQGMSVDDVTAMLAHTPGWRYATTDEVKYLFESNLPSFVTSSATDGYPFPGAYYADWQTDHDNEAHNLVALLGDTMSFIYHGEFGVIGAYNRPLSPEGCVGYPCTALAGVLSRSAQAQYLVTMQGGIDNYYGAPYSGHFLVSFDAPPISIPPHSIPEPSTSLLMLTGGLLLATRALVARLGGN